MHCPVNVKKLIDFVTWVCVLWQRIVKYWEETAAVFYITEGHVFNPLHVMMIHIRVILVFTVTSNPMNLPSSLSMFYLKFKQYFQVHLFLLF